MGGAASRPQPVERPEELPEARETISALRASQRRLAKEIGALDIAPTAGFGRERVARTRLVTIRLVDERLAAEGKTPEHRDVIRLAAVAGLKHAEALVWPGGLRVVFSEESIVVGGPARVTGGGSEIARLAGQLSELHGQQMAFFLALLDARLGFDTAASASVQRQAESEKEGNQVPPALLKREDVSQHATPRNEPPQPQPQQQLGYPHSPQTPLPGAADASWAGLTDMFGRGAPYHA